MAGAACAGDRDTSSAAGTHVAATVEFTDGSRLVGAPDDAPLSLKLDFGHLAIPLTEVRQWDAASSGRKVVVQLLNGDRLTGVLAQSQLPLDTVLGRLSPDVKLIRSVSYRTWREGHMPPGEGTLAFGELNWTAWRTEFAVDGDRLTSLPKARAGFQYGHDGHGRGPMLVANVGDANWRDYSIDAVFCVTGVDPSFNPYGLGSDYHDGNIMFHVVDARESFNECGGSFYVLGLHGDGTWDLRCVYNDYCAQPMGWGSSHHDAERTLAKGSGVAIDRTSGNRFRIDVVGNRIQAWVDDTKLLDVVDDAMPQEIGGKRLDYGGVGFMGGFDAMFWIKNVTVRTLASPDASL